MSDDTAAKLAAYVRGFMPQQHRDFFEMLPYLFAGSTDQEGRVWASILVSPRPGVERLAETPTERRVAFNTRLLPGDPLSSALAKNINSSTASNSHPHPLYLGVLGIELPTRRRNRVNGHIVDISRHGDDDDGGSRIGFVMDVDQSFGNCPKYIQTREVVPTDRSKQEGYGQVTAGGSRLTQEQEALVRRSDTLFLATTNINDLHSINEGSEDSHNGVDVSHRGGKPGFVRVSVENDHSVLIFPDYLGNFLFQSLGNLQCNPRCGLLFLDFESGDVLHLTGKADVLFEEQSMPGAQRMVRFELERSIQSRSVLPFKYKFISNSTFLPEVEQCEVSQ